MNGILTLRDGMKVEGRIVSRTKSHQRWSCRMVFPAEAGAINWRLAMTLSVGRNVEQCSVSSERLGQNLCVVRVMSENSDQPPWR